MSATSTLPPPAPPQAPARPPRPAPAPVPTLRPAPSAPVVRPARAPETPEKLWDFVRPYAWRHRRAILLAVLCNVLPGLAITVQTLTPKFLVDDVLVPTHLLPGARLGRLLVLLTVFLFSALVLRMLAWYASFKIFTGVRERITLELRARFFRHINHLCLRFHGRHTSGELFSYVMGTPLTDIGQFYNNVVINVPNAVVTFCLSVGWVLSWDWAETLVLVLLVGATVFAMKEGSRHLVRLFEEYQATESRIIGRVADIFRGNRDVKMYAIEEPMSQAFEQSADVLRAKACDRDVSSHRINMRQEAISYVCFALLCAVGAWRYLGGHLTEGQLVAFLAAFGTLQPPLALLFNLGALHGRAVAGHNRLRAVLGAGSTTPEPAPERRLVPPVQGDLELCEVRFCYEPGRAVLDGINLTIPFGQRVAFVGPSGSGKSTVAKLLLRLYDPDAGAVTLGGVDLRRCRTVDVRQRFGVVPQDPYFFCNTVRENLRLTRPDATEADLRRACELANAWEFIAALPQGLDTVIGEGGARLSGGQRQRLAIARALLHDPRYLLFDEATSALDTVSERLVQEALGRVLTERTAVFIAHRLSTIKNCDRILVLDRGQVVQDGTFAELATSPGLFREMVESDKF